jgi:hypothetical protein
MNWNADAPHRSREHGIATVVVLYGMSAFAVLALTMLTDNQLRATFKAGEEGLHVVIYAAGAGSEKFVARLNIPARWRANEEDFGVEVAVPPPPSADLDADVGPGWLHAIQLAPNVRLCCDTGDGACGSQPADTQLPVGAVNRHVAAPASDATERQVFSLTTLDADTTILDPRVVNENALLVKAEHATQASDPAGLAGGLMCTLERDATIVATGRLALRPSRGAQPGPFAGELEVSYVSTTSQTP